MILLLHRAHWNHAESWSRQLTPPNLRSRGCHSPEQITTVAGLDICFAGQPLVVWRNQMLNLRKDTYAHHLSFDSKLLPGLFNPRTDSTVCCTLRLYGDDYFGGQPVLRPSGAGPARLLAPAGGLGLSAAATRRHDGASVVLDGSSPSHSGISSRSGRKPSGPSVSGRPAGTGSFSANPFPTS